MRSGKLVRIDRDGALPDRCVLCNADAGGYRLTRKLYWSPLAWRIVAISAPFVLLGLGIMLQWPIVLAAFWPLVIMLMLIHVFVRRPLTIELAACKFHRDARSILRTLSLLCLGSVFLAIALFRDWQHSLLLLWGSAAGLLLLAVLQAYSGLSAVRLTRLTMQHAWLARTGRAFRAALPELPS